MNARSPEAPASIEGSSHMPVVPLAIRFAAPPRIDQGLVVPPDDHLLLVRADAKATGKLKDLRQVVAAWEAVAKKCNLAFEEMVRLAVFRLEVERDLGSELAQTVHQGGDRSRCHRGILLRDGGLPDGISAKQSSQYQRLAAIPAQVFQAYLEAACASHRVPSSSGARRFSAPHGPNPSKTRSMRARVTHSAELTRSALDAVSRVITPDVCVGDPGINAKRRVAAQATGVFDELAGDVFVANCPEPALWLPTLQRLREKARLQDVIIVLPAAVWEDWFRGLGTNEWTLCFLEGVRSKAGVGVVLVRPGYMGDTRVRAHG